jgi:hypothetical protein
MRIVLLGVLYTPAYIGRLTPISLRPIAEVNQWGGEVDIYLVPPPIIQVCVCVWQF